MHWQNFNRSVDVAAKVQSIFEFCRTLVETSNDLKRIESK